MKSLLELVGGPTILIFAGGIIAAVGTVWAAIDQAKNARKLEAKNEEIAQLNRTITQTIIGGDSFCTMALSPYGGSTCTFAQHGTFPVYDVVATIVDLDKMEASIKAGTGGDPDTFTVIHNVGNLAVKGLSDVRSLVKLEGDKKRLNIFFRARNGSFVQLLRETKACRFMAHSV